VQSYALLDSRDYASLTELFAADGVWDRGGRRRRGRAEIAAALAERPEDKRTMHVITNVVITIGGKMARGTAYLMVTRGPAATAQVEHWIIADRYVLTPEGWRIAERQQERDANA
jgi:hypothetical protein